MEQEKKEVVISEDASVGIYCFKTGKVFCKLAELAVKSGTQELYIAPLYILGYLFSPIYWDPFPGAWFLRACLLP